MVLNPYRFNSRHALKQREACRARLLEAARKKGQETALESMAAALADAQRVKTRRDIERENIQRAAKSLADYLCDCAAGKVKHSADIEKERRYMLHGYTTGQWVVFAMEGAC